MKRTFLHEMRATRRGLRATLLVVLAAAFLAGSGLAASPRVASAAIGPADDRQLTTVTGWWTYQGVTAAQVNSYLSANGARLTKIQVESSTPTFTVVMVKNSGSYASGYWWYYGQTEAQVNSQLSSHSARPISISAYSTSLGVRYAVVMVPNSGANAKASWWYHGTSTYIAGRLSANSARLTELGTYPGGGYTAIMVNNTGTNATGWWWYYGISASSVTSHLTTNHARLIDLSRNSTGTYNVVMYSSSTRAYWYYGYTPGTMLNKANQLGQRIISVVSYTSGGVKYQAAAMVRNTNTLSEKLWSIIGPKVDSGAYGFYLKQVGGSTLASLQQTKQYEPASALKVLYHAKSIHEQALGNTFDSTVITYHYNPADPTNKDICPDDYASTSTTDLKNADTKMMQVSDNRMTRGILEKYTKASMLSYATSLGLTATQINHNIGCGTPHNKTTLVDLGKVYEAFQNGVVTSSSTWKTQFRSRMLNQGNYSGFQTSICPIVSAEAASLGKSAATATSFCNAMTWIAKGGSYSYGSVYPYTVSWDGLSLTSVPFKSSGVLAPRFYVFGEFIDGTSISGSTEANSVNAARSKLFQEALRPYIRAALTTW
jgi:Beta-lactamase enzyme family